MFFNQPYNGSSLPSKSLCFTFDDGPGPNTIPIAEYLHREGIRATFFVVGKYAIESPEILARLIELGHTVGNHTYEHPDLPYYVSLNGDIQDQVLRTDAVIRPYVGNNVFFRAPYGKWSPEVAAELNANLFTALNYIGPIHWDIGGVDCWHWFNGWSVEAAVDAYVLDIEKHGKGIVVFHDEIADMDFLKPANQTLELLKQLVPKLKTQGYTFVDFHSIEALKKAAEEALTFELGVNGKSLVISEKGTVQLGKSGSPFSAIKMPKGQLRLVYKDYNFMLNAEQLLITREENLSAIFDYIPVRNNRFMLRSYTGNYLALNVDKELAATAKFMIGAAVFSYKPLQTAANTTLTFKEKLLLFKKGVLFVKSKLFSS
jgi:peptidoglycan/xylan/chitin deacetylase (PgdA/CDA1 family)